MQTSDVDAEVDAELEAIQSCLNAIDVESLDREGRARVILYVGSRLGFDVVIDAASAVMSPTLPPAA